MERDKEVSKHYKKRGWKIIRIWEHEISKNLNKVLKKTYSDINKQL